MRIRIENMTGRARDTMIVDADTGVPIRGVRAVRVQITEEGVEAELDLWHPSAVILATVGRIRKRWLPFGRRRT